MLTDPSTGKIPQSLEENERIPVPPTGKILQQLEESPRHRPSQRPKSSTHWKDLDAHKANSGEIVPVDGKIWTLTRSLAGRLFQRLEELRLGRC